MYSPNNGRDFNGSSVSDRLLQLAADERFGAFVVPVGSRRRMKTPHKAARCTRSVFRIVPNGPTTSGVTRQSAKQARIVLAAKEHNGFLALGKHVRIVIAVLVASAFVHAAIRAERDIVGRNQVVRPDETPARREDEETIETAVIRQHFIRLVVVELPRRKKMERVVPRSCVVLEKNGSPRLTGIGDIIRPRV